MPFPLLSAIRVATAVVVGGLVLASAGCTPAPEVSPTPSASTTEAAGDGLEGPDLPAGDRAYLRIGGREDTLTSRCSSSTPARSTVVAAMEDGRELAVTVFVATDPVVEVDYFDDDGTILLSTPDLGRGRWAFRGATLVGLGVIPNSDTSAGFEFAIDFSADLPDCDNQDELGPGNGDADETPTPDVIRT